jgi:cell wall-associated NlpC family hydrolase
MILKHLTKKVIVTSVLAGSLFVLPQMAPHNASAAGVSISTTHQVLHTGSVGSSVRAVQTKLKMIGYYHDTIDGVYGSHTRSAVIAYQRAHYLSVDGIAGPKTLAKLFGTSSTAVGSTSVRTMSTNATFSRVNSIISNAEAYGGTPYRYGGTTPSGFDCSGFTSYVFAKNGITLPRTAAQQFAQGSPTNLVPGALVFFSTTSSGISHVGIYIGNNEFISATSSHGVAIASLNNSYWGPRYRGARTFINNVN